MGTAWTQSAEFRAMARRQMRKLNAERALLPKCGATCRDGHSCRQPVIRGRKRCYYHGGRTPRGDTWHKRVWPDRLSKNGGAKVFAKLNHLEHAAKQLANKIAAMSPAERKLYEKWRAAHKPGSAAQRRQYRAEREQNRGARNLFSAERPTNPEASAIQDRIDALKADLVRLQGERVAAEIADAIDQKKGVFG